MVLTHKIHTSILEISVIVRIIGDPEKVAKAIFNGTIDPKTGKLLIPKSVLLENDIECRLKRYNYQNEVDAPQELLIVFGVIGNNSKSSIIANFLFEKLKDFKKTYLVINKQQINIDYELIYNLLEESRN